MALLGVNNQNLKIIQHAFPKLKIIARGNEIIIKGEANESKDLSEKLNRMVRHVERHDNLPEEKLHEILGDVAVAHTPEEDAAAADKTFLLLGNDGIVIRAKTPNQIKLVEAATNNDLIFAIGPAGTGKTYTSVAIAVRALKRKEIKRIII